MKKMMVMSAAVFALCFTAKAQCDKKIKWTASKLEMIDTAGNVRSKDGEVTIITGNESIVITDDKGSEEMKGSIIALQCNWQDKKNGKINFKSELTDKEGKLRHATINIEAKDGQTIITMAAEEEETTLRLPVTAYEEIP